MLIYTLPRQVCWKNGQRDSSEVVLSLPCLNYCLAERLAGNSGLFFRFNCQRSSLGESRQIPQMKIHYTYPKIDVVNLKSLAGL
jgi:hypothetical protein